MKEDLRIISRLAAAFLLLFTISVYRQIGMRLYPGDAIRPVIVYIVYLFLLGVWIFSIHARFTQKHMRMCLYVQGAVAVFWVTVRFIQEAYLQQFIYPLRMTGYLITVPAVLIPLFAFYASLGLGRSDDYRMARKHWLLIIPALSLIFLALTDEYHHLFCYVAADEPQPNLYFHPFIGSYLVYLWALSGISLRVNIIYHRSRDARTHSRLRKLITLYEPAAILLFSLPYVISAFVVKYEIIEYTAGLVFIIVTAWELYIFAGLVPVNSHYQEVFENSTAAMQILGRDGSLWAASRNAPEINEERFSRLKSGKDVYLGMGFELHMHAIADGYLVWQNDFTQIHGIISDLKRMNEELEQEDSLLREEFRLRSYEAKLNIKNQIYDSLSTEVSPQITLLKKMIRSDACGQQPEICWRRICLVGTYVKRFCSLKLTYQETGNIQNDDLRLSLADILQCAREAGIKSELRFSPRSSLQPGFSLFIIKTLECLIESTDFGLSAINVSILQCAYFTVAVSDEPAPPVERINELNKNGYHISWQESAGGYRLQACGREAI